MEHVIIGVDPHKLSATIEVVDHHERLVGLGRFTTDRAGDTAMLRYAKAWPDWTWSVEASKAGPSPLRRTQVIRPLLHVIKKVTCGY